MRSPDLRRLNERRHLVGGGDRVAGQEDAPTGGSAAACAAAAETEPVTSGQLPQLAGDRPHRSAVTAVTTTSAGASESAARRACRAACRRRGRRSASRASAARARTRSGPRSCCSPGRQASSASGPRPRPQPRARPSSRPRSDARGEVLLRDRGLAALPALAELVQVRQDDLRQQRVDRRDGEQAVEHRLRARLVEAVERVGEVAQRRRGAGAPASAAVAVLGARRQRGRLGRGQARPRGAPA